MSPYKLILGLGAGTSQMKCLAVSNHVCKIKVQLMSLSKTQISPELHVQLEVERLTIPVQMYLSNYLS